MEHPDVPLVRFLRSFSLQAPHFDLLKSFKFARWRFQRLFSSLLSAVFFLCSSLLHLNLVGPLSVSLAVGGSGGGGREGRRSALTAGREKLSGEGGGK